MGKSLVIVESPAKAKTINKYLGNQFVVKSSVGHIRDLPVARNTKKPVDAKARARAAAETRKLSAEQKLIHKKQKARTQLIERMGIDPDHGWTAHYEILPGKEKVVNELKRLAESADTVYLATDLDREGEAIAWHLQETIGGNPDKYRRVVFNEITKHAIQEAFSDPGQLNQNRVNAQQARRFLDRIVGYMVSPLLWAKIARGLSAGRVQSVAVKLIVEREREIRQFVPEEYWEIYTDLSTGKKESIRFQVAKSHGKTFKPVNHTEAMAAVEQLRSSCYTLTHREDKPTQSRPAAPFITSTLQQAASTRLGFSVKKTMMLAQRLYEAGHITYMRTDSTNLSQDAIVSARDYIEKSFGHSYLPEKPNVYSSKKGAQEAHEAIRPSSVNQKPDKLSGLERDAQRLYSLIWHQFVACQMTPAKYLSSTLIIETGGFELKAKGRTLIFDGFTRVQPPFSRKTDDIILPDIQNGEELTLDTIDPRQLFTRPSARFSEAALVKELEKRGIGRPSTYASIISTIQDRGYVSVKNRRFYAEKMGDIVTDRLSESFHDLMDYSFTAKMEESLDSIANSGQYWKQVLDGFYAEFRKQLEQAESDHGGMRANNPSPTDIPCPSCSRSMMIRTASTGVFLGCSGYALPPKERCKSTINLVSGDEAQHADDENMEVNALRAMHRCSLCGTAMESYLIDETRKLHVCGNNPDCPGYEVEKGHFKIKGYDGPTLECDKCGAEMQLKSGRFGKYFGCTNSECKNTRKLLKSGEAAPPKMDPVPMPELKCQKVDDHYVLRDGASGLFLAASQFPKKRETRAPLVAELIPYQGMIDPKYHYLLEAPQQDPEGNPAIIRYSRKTKQSYVMSEKNDKASGWSALYEKGAWQEKQTKKRAAKKDK
ncbi:DNA topoisomerase 1 [invertebrate metagenome]|uniref:DNA topoisomerase n=1 Tax=invertebrate metagenome TaxID=1711999 RepID=A0A2H9T4Q8_9ZZZZ